MPNVTISAVTQVSTTPDGALANMLITYQIDGPGADFVELYAVNAAATDPSLLDHSADGNWITDFDVSLDEFIYSQSFQLGAGSIWTLFLCPRTGSQDDPDNEINGDYWESSCVFRTVTTTTSAPSGPGLVPPKITSTVPAPATLKQGNTITITWSSPTTYQKFQIWNTFDGEPLEQGSTEGEPPANSWTAQTAPGHRYTFQVQGGVSGGFSYTWSSWGPMVSVLAVENLHSLRQCLIYSEINPAGAVLSSLVPSGDTLRNFMQL
jgi:hypothetical protein